MKICDYFINTTDKDIGQKFRLKKITEINSYFIEEIDQNKLLDSKSKRFYTTLNMFLTIAFAVTACISLSAFASLADISKGNMSSMIGLDVCEKIIAKFQKHKSIT